MGFVNQCWWLFWDRPEEVSDRRIAALFWGTRGTWLPGAKGEKGLASYFYIFNGMLVDIIPYSSVIITEEMYDDR